MNSELWLLPLAAGPDFLPLIKSMLVVKVLFIATCYKLFSNQESLCLTGSRTAVHCSI